MEMRTVGGSGLQASIVGLGCNNFGMRIDKDAAAAVVHAALDCGYTMFDTSDSYGRGQSEEFLGAALGNHRDDVVVATKFFSPMGDGPYMRGASRKYIIRACEASLRRLDTDYIDLYYQHRVDPLTPVEETLSALDDLVRQGKVRYVACSNHPGWMVADADHIARRAGLSRFVANQVEWNVMARDVERECVPVCRRFEVGVIPFFPLASGLLTGKYRRGEAFPADSRLAAWATFSKLGTDDNLAVVERLEAVAGERGHTIVELAMSWVAGQAGVASVLAGATKPEQVRANAEAVSWQMTADDLTAVDEALRRDPV